MLKILAALALGIAIGLPAVTATANEDNGSDRAPIVAPGQLGLNPAPSMSSDVWQVEAARDCQ